MVALMPKKTAADATRLLREYVESGRSRTDLLKRVAELIVELRAKHTLDDGRIDWSGRSPAYRAAISEIYKEAGVPADKLDTVQAALRYHVGNMIRDRADDYALQAVGLTNVAPRERLNRNREIVAALAASGSVADVTGDPLRLIAGAEALLDHVDESALRTFRGKERVAARHALAGLRDRAEALRALTETRGGGRTVAAETV